MCMYEYKCLAQLNLAENEERERATDYKEKGGLDSLTQWISILCPRNQYTQFKF